MLTCSYPESWHLLNLIIAIPGYWSEETGTPSKLQMRMETASPEVIQKPGFVAFPRAFEGEAQYPCQATVYTLGQACS